MTGLGQFREVLEREKRTPIEADEEGFVIQIIPGSERERVTIGRIAFDGKHLYYKKEVDRDRHMLRKMKAWGVNAAVVNALAELGGRVELHDKKNKVWMRLNAREIQENFPSRKFNIYEEQYFVLDESWEKFEENKGG